MFLQVFIISEYFAVDVRQSFPTSFISFDFLLNPLWHFASNFLFTSFLWRFREQSFTEYTKEQSVEPDLLTLSCNPITRIRRLLCCDNFCLHSKVPVFSHITKPFGYCFLTAPLPTAFPPLISRGSSSSARLLTHLSICFTICAAAFLGTFLWFPVGIHQSFMDFCFKNRMSPDYDLRIVYQRIDSPGTLNHLCDFYLDFFIFHVGTQFLIGCFRGSSEAGVIFSGDRTPSRHRFWTDIPDRASLTLSQTLPENRHFLAEEFMFLFSMSSTSAPATEVWLTLFLIAVLAGSILLVWPISWNFITLDWIP